MHIPHSAWTTATEIERNELAAKLETVGAGSQKDILLLSKGLHDPDHHWSDQLYTEGNATITLRQSIPSPFPHRTPTILLAATGRNVISDVEAEQEHGRRDLTSAPQSIRSPSISPFEPDISFDHGAEYDDPTPFHPDLSRDNEPSEGILADPGDNAEQQSSTSPTPPDTTNPDDIILGPPLRRPTDLAAISPTPLARGAPSTTGTLHEPQLPTDSRKPCFRCTKHNIQCIQNRSTSTSSASVPSCHPCKKAGRQCSASDPAWYSNGDAYWKAFDKILELKRSILSADSPDRVPPAPLDQLVTSFLDGLLLNRGLALFASDNQFVEVNAMLEDAGLPTFAPRRP